jgi:hypothetical protein
MADAQITGGIRALVEIPMRTGMPRDTVVNTFAFKMHAGTATTDAARDDVIAALNHFYLNGATGINPLGAYLGQAVNRGTNQCMIKTYDMAEAPPRTPRIGTFTLPTVSGSYSPIPSEVALCLSFKAASKKGPSGRGRVFFGPINGGAVAEDSDYVNRPTSALINSLKHAGAALRDECTSVGIVDWCIYSTIGTDHLHPVTDVWVDNEFDTMRKRGFRATSRVTG